MGNETENKSEMSDEKTKSIRFKNAICYIPLIAFVLFFVEDNKSKDYAHHIKNGMYLFIFALFCGVILSIVHIGGLATLAYIIASAYFAHKAYSGDDVNIELFTKIEQKIKNKM